MTSVAVPFYQALIQKLPVRQKTFAKVLARIAGSNVRSIVNDAKIRLDLNEMIQLEMFLGTYEPVQTMWFKECLRPGDIFVDVGANFGWYTTLSAKLVGKTGKVYAFEPSPVAGEVLEKMIAESGFANVLLTKAAVGKSSGHASLFLPITKTLHSPSILASDDNFRPISVQVLTLDEFFSNKCSEKIRLIKIDVEGYEPDVLAGMGNLIADGKVENIICEFNSGWLKRNSCTPEELFEQFKKYGFRVVRQTEREEHTNLDDGQTWSLQDFWFSLT